MIQLKPDCLIFETSDGEKIPCSAEWVSLELLGDCAPSVEPEVVENASAAVLHYFKYELNQNFVSVGDFAQALAKVLRNLGVELQPVGSRPPLKVLESDLVQIAEGAGDGGELLFFRQLREDIKCKLVQAPQILRFNNLRPCVRRLTGSPRWNHRCQLLNDQIVDFLRTCWSAEPAAQACALLVL